MTTSLARSRSALLPFAGVATGVFAASLAIARLLEDLDRPGAVAIGLTLDMVIVVPLAFYFLIVRRRGWPTVTLAPVFVASVAAASWVLPAAHQQPLAVVKALAVPLELGLVGWIAWRAARAFRGIRGEASADSFDRIRGAALDLVRHERAAAILATEVAVFYYALGAWRRRPHAPAGTTAITHHRCSGHARVVTAFLLILGLEGLAVHVLLSIWSPLAAWIFTMGTLYGALWLVADFRAVVLRPILIDEEEIRIRAGLRWSLSVPRSLVSSVDREAGNLGKERLDVTFLGCPTHWITLTRPVAAEGPYGLRRRVRSIGIQPDEGDEIDRLLAPAPPDAPDRPTP